MIIRVKCQSLLFDFFFLLFVLNILVESNIKHTNTKRNSDTRVEYCDQVNQNTK